MIIQHKGLLCFILNNQINQHHSIHISNIIGSYHVITYTRLIIIFRHSLYCDCGTEFSSNISTKISNDLEKHL